MRSVTHDVLKVPQPAGDAFHRANPSGNQRRPAPWTDDLLDSFADLLASKMVALVERGAPRDFRDVYTVCQSGLATPAECWRLWRERQRSAGYDADPSDLEEDDEAAPCAHRRRPA